MNAMHPSIEGRREVLGVLRQRTLLATQEFYDLVGITMPVLACRFKVVPRGREFFHVVEESTGKVRGFRRNHNAACELAKTLEQRQ